MLNIFRLILHSALREKCFKISNVFYLASSLETVMTSNAVSAEQRSGWDIMTTLLLLLIANFVQNVSEGIKSRKTEIKLKDNSFLICWEWPNWEISDEGSGGNTVKDNTWGREMQENVLLNQLESMIMIRNEDEESSDSRRKTLDVSQCLFKTFWLPSRI